MTTNCSMTDYINLYQNLNKRPMKTHEIIFNFCGIQLNNLLYLKSCTSDTSKDISLCNVVVFVPRGVPFISDCYTRVQKLNATNAVGTK